MKEKLLEDVVALSNVTRWLACIEEDEPVEQVDLDLRASLATYVTELRFRAGLLKPYRDDLHRLGDLKSALRKLDSVYDCMGELVGDAVMLPAEIISLQKFLGGMVTDFGGIIWAIEQNHPELASAFTNDRWMYAEFRAGRGPLAGGPWEPEDEADHGQTKTSL
jgi:hypothetical protein